MPSYSVDEEWFFEYPEISNAVFVAPRDTFNGFFSSVFYHQKNGYGSTQWYLLLKDALEMSMEQLDPMLQSFKRTLQPNGGVFASNTHIIKYEIHGEIDPVSQKLLDLEDYGFYVVDFYSDANHADMGMHKPGTVSLQDCVDFMQQHPHINHWILNLEYVLLKNSLEYVQEDRTRMGMFAELPDELVSRIIDEPNPLKRKRAFSAQKLQSILLC